MTAATPLGGIFTSAIEAGAKPLARGAVAGARAILTGVSRIPFSRREFLILAKDLAVGVAVDNVVTYAGKYNDWVKENQGIITLLAYLSLSAKLNPGVARQTGGRNLRLSSSSTSKSKRAFFGAPLASFTEKTLELIKRVQVVNVSATSAHLKAGKHWFKVQVDRATSKLTINCSVPEVAATLAMIGIGNKDLLTNSDPSVVEDAILSLCEQGLAHLLASIEDHSEREALNYLRTLDTATLLSYPMGVTKKIAAKYSLSLDRAAALRDRVLGEVEDWHPGCYFSDYGKDAQGNVVYVIGESSLCPSEDGEFPIDQKPSYILKPILPEVTPIVSSSAAAMMDAVDNLLTHATNQGSVDFYRPKSLNGTPTFTPFEGAPVCEYLLSRASCIPSSYKEGNLYAHWAQFVAFRPLPADGNTGGEWSYTLIGHETVFDDRLDRNDVTALDDDYSITIDEALLQRASPAIESEEQPVELAVNADQLLEGLFGDHK